MAAKGKKRYYVTLTQQTVERYQEIALSMNMPTGTMSIILDESLEKVVDVMEHLKKKGTCTFADLFQMIGQEIDQIHKEEVKTNDSKEVDARKSKKTGGERARR